MIIALAATLALAGEPTCVSAYGKTACGYNCVAAYGDVKCADWSGGTCEAAFGTITCGPPAPTVVHTRRPHYSASSEEAKCLSAFGKTACGWDCKAAFGDVKCADWPGGACEAAFGQVVCGPHPPAYARHHGQKASCVAAFGQIACGWSCEAAFGKVSCASTPQGRCEVAFGEITCWDPQ